MEKVVLAYSGGLDTSVILKWLIERGHEVVAFIADLGQGEDLEKARAKAMKVGAVSAHVRDVRREFVTDYIFPALRGSARYEGRYLLGTALARPLIAKWLVQVAKEEKAAYVSHGATGKGNDQVRFELGAYALHPTIKILAPWKTPEFQNEFKGRPDLLKYAADHGIEVEATSSKPYSMDGNLLHLSYEAGILEDPAAPPPRDMFRLTVDPRNAPNEPCRLDIEFAAGNPVKVTDASTGASESDPLKMMVMLNTLGGQHGIGRVDMIEDCYVGIKCRCVYETPGFTILWAAHQDLETLTIDREVYRLKETLVPRFGELIYYGYWFSPEMEFIRHALDKSQESVNGVVHLELCKGNVTVVGRSSPTSLYNQDLSSMDVHGGYDQQDAAGFICPAALLN
jgi:argininosuccinate synthase